MKKVYKSGNKLIYQSSNSFIRYYASSSSSNTQNNGDNNTTYGTETITANDKLPGHSFTASSSSIPKEASVLKFTRHGHPLQVLQLEKEPLPTQIPADHSLVAILQAPIHWMDINHIQGTYPISSTSSNTFNIPGSECLATILSSSQFSRDDHVIPLTPFLGTWRSHAVLPNSALLKVPQNIKPEYSSSLLISPCTALRLANDYPTPANSTILINSASGFVAQTLVQLLSKKSERQQLNLSIVAIARDREHFDTLSERLKAFGASLVLTMEDFVKGKSFWEGMLEEKFGEVSIAFDGTGGEGGREMFRWLGKRGRMVVYGGMSRKGVSVGSGDLIWGSKKIEGFWLEDWRQENGRKGMEAMVKEMWREIEGDKETQKGKLRFMMERWGFKDWRRAVGRAMGQNGAYVKGAKGSEGVGQISDGSERGRDRKVVLVMRGHEFVNRELDDDVIENATS